MSDQTVINSDCAKYINTATEFMMKKKYMRALDAYLTAVRCCPDLRSVHEENIAFAFTQHLRQLKRRGQFQEMFSCFEKVFTVVPDSLPLLNNMGAYLFGLGFVEESAQYFRKVLRLDPNDVMARENLDNLYNNLVDRWHFRMLNDHVRNAAYHAAIDRAVKCGYNRVLDIGAGTGLLSMFAASSGATEVYACEQLDVMCNIARDVIADNRLHDRITIINKNSTDICIPGDLTSKVSLVVMEIFDAGLLGEGAIETVLHAWSYLLDTSGILQARIIPSRAAVWVCALECGAIHKQNRFLFPSLPQLDFGEVKVMCVTGSEEEGAEPYTSEFLHRLPNGYRFLSSPAVVGCVDFNNVQSLHALLDSQSAHVLSVTEAGRLDGLAVWFDLDLDEMTTISTRPDTHSCWEQAIYPVKPRYHGDSFLVLPGDSINATFTWSIDKLQVTDVNICKAAAALQTNAEATVTEQNFRFYCSREDIEVLNDLDFNRALCAAIEQQVKVVEGVRPPRALHLTQQSSLVSLQMLKMGVSDITVVTPDPVNCDLLRAVALTSNLDDGCVTFIDADTGLEELGRQWSLLVADVVSSSGCLHEQALEDVALARATCLLPDATVIPCKVAMYAIIIQSDQLLADSRVIGTQHTQGFSVADHINNYATSNFVGVHLTSLPHLRLTNAFHLLTFDLAATAHDDAPSPFLSQSATVVVEAVAMGQPTALVYWFDMTLTDGIVASTLDARYHWKQAAKMLHCAPNVNQGDSLAVRVVCKNSCFTVSLNQVDDDHYNV